MATRNRTPLYRKYRDALRHVRLPASSLPSSSKGGGGSGPVIEMVSSSLLRQGRSYVPLSTEDPGSSSNGALTFGLPPAWVDISEDISANMQRARTKMSQLVKAHEKALMPSFGDGKDDQHMIEDLTQEITDLLRKSEKRLQKFSPSDPSEDSAVRKNVQRSLATDLQKLSMEFRKQQSSYLRRLRQQKEGPDSVDLEMNLSSIRSRIEDEDFADVGFDELQMSKLKRSEALTKEREREIVQVVESVNELAQIMKDLSVLVIDQATLRSDLPSYMVPFKTSDLVFHRPKDGTLSALRSYVEEETRDLSGEALSRFMDQLYERIPGLLESIDVAENLCALRSINDYIKIALDWLHGERIEYRHFAAVLILKVSPNV